MEFTEENRDKEEIRLLTSYVNTLEGEFAKNKQLMKVLIEKIEEDQLSLTQMSSQVKLLSERTPRHPCSSDSGTQTEDPSASSE